MILYLVSFAFFLQADILILKGIWQKMPKKKETRRRLQPRIPIPEERIKRFCRSKHIRKLALFGSVLTERFRKSSDIDMLVEFHPKHIPGLIKLAGIEIELGEILGRKVDLRSPNDLSSYFRKEVLEKAYHLYGRKRFHPD